MEWRKVQPGLNSTTHYVSFEKSSHTVPRLATDWAGYKVANISFPLHTLHVGAMPTIQLPRGIR